jgi:hypothetical protein
VLANNARGRPCVMKRPGLFSVREVLGDAVLGDIALGTMSVKRAEPEHAWQQGAEGLERES